VWSGIYSVSAAREHFGLTTWILEQVRDQSVATHSAFVEVPDLDDPDMARLGGAHYEGVCVSCHARPGAEIGAVVAQMLPSPPHLSEALAENTPEEIFWVVKHGLKYTGMPAFPTQARDDEVWAVTAFLARLAEARPLDDYRAIAGLDRLPNPSRGAVAEPPTRGTGVVAVTQCIRCHDDAAVPTHTELVPRLAGQSAEYLRRSLREYASGHRPSGIMQPVADALSTADAEQLVAYYSALPRLPAGSAGRQGNLDRGRELAEAGDLESDIPACLSCHGASGSAQFPNLAGQNAAYIVVQLQVWRDGGRTGTTYGRIMAPIARRLSAEQVQDVAAYFGSLEGLPESSTAQPGEARR
jgi:cytochrome c553